MKRFSLFGLYIFMVLLLAAPAQASPVRLTMSGTVFRIDGDQYLANDAGIYVDSAVSFTHIIDVDLDAFSVEADGDVTITDDFYYGGNLTYDYFYAEQVSGPSYGMPMPTGNLVVAFHRGQDNRWDNKTELVTGTGFENSSLIAYNELADITLGEYFYGTTTLKTSSGPGPYAYVRTHLYLQSMSAVPIPSAIWFLGSGLIGLVGFRSKFRKA